MKDAILAFVFSVFVAAMAYADDLPQGWVPEAITSPEDAEVTVDRAVGSRIRMFSFSTKTDVEALFQEWSVALEESKFTLREQQPEFGETVIEFSGRGILNAKIAISSSNSGELVEINFDATLR